VSKKVNNPVVLAMAFLLAFCFLLTGRPGVAEAGENPPPEEIAEIFDRVAAEKKVPAEILKAIAFVESGWRQWDKNGRVVISGSGSRPNIGIMQVSAYDPKDTETINNLKNNIAYNIAYGAEVLKDKWNMTPLIGNGDPGILENWYFALWAYNSWSTRNNPHNNQNPYQDKVLKIMATDYYYGLVKPVTVTPVPKSLIPAGTLPSRNTTWETPQPSHLAAFAGGISLSRGQEANLLASVKRIFGTHRIETAVKIAYQGWPNGCETVLITTSESFADALAGAPLAKINNAPVLITPSDLLDPRVEEALLTLKPLRVIILGGEKAVSDRVEKKIRETLTWTEDIRRIAGNDRFDTAAKIAVEFPVDNGVALTTGLNFPDALSLASAAAAKGYPLLLTGKDSLPEPTKNALRQLSPDFLYIGGGEKVVSRDVLNEIKETASLPEEKIIRFQGGSRYETSAQIVNQFFMQVTEIYITSGEDFPDALAGAALAACCNAPMLLVPPQGIAVGSATEQYLKTLAANSDAPVEVRVFGGQKAVSDESVIKVKYLLSQK